MASGSTLLFPLAFRLDTEGAVQASPLAEPSPGPGRAAACSRQPPSFAKVHAARPVPAHLPPPPPPSPGAAAAAAACCCLQDVALSPTHRLLATALDSGALLLHVYDDGPGGSLQLWQKRLLRPFGEQGRGAPPACTAARFIGGRLAAGGASGALWVGDVESGRAVWAQGGTGARVKCMAALQAPQLLISGGPSPRGWAGFAAHAAQLACWCACHR